MFQKTTQKSESRTSPGLSLALSLSPPLSHLIRPLPPFFIPPPPPPCLLFVTRPLSILLSPSSAIPLTFSSLCRPSLSLSLFTSSLHSFSRGYCLPRKCLKSIPPTPHSSVCELPPNLSFHWQLHNVLRSCVVSRDAVAHSNLIVRRWHIAEPRSTARWLNERSRHRVILSQGPLKLTWHMSLHKSAFFLSLSYLWIKDEILGALQALTFAVKITIWITITICKCFRGILQDIV